MQCSTATALVKNNNNNMSLMDVLVNVVLNWTVVFGSD